MILMIFSTRYCHCLPLQGSFSHGLLLESSPEQGKPDPAGFGEVHDRVLVVVPGPHAVEHSVHDPHSDQPPSTAVSDVSRR